jgi:ankyrin repeat protein
MDSPEDVQRLKLLVSDLTRRLQNAQHTIEAERNVAKNATAQAEYYRIKITDISNVLRLENSKNLNLERKKIKETEAIKFEANKLRAAKLHDELRLVELDHLMTKYKKEPLKLTRLRSKVEALEQEQNSQKVLLQQLCELDKLNEELSTAAQHNNTDECNILLRSGASVNYVDNAGYLPLHYACAGGHFNVVKLLLEFGSDYSSTLTGHSPLIVAATSGHNQIIKLLMDFGCRLEDTGSGGRPATHIAFLHNQFDTLDYLLSVGADINSSNPNEDTLLHLAVQSTAPDAVAVLQQLLQVEGVDSERINKQNLSPLQLALYSRNKPAVDVLGGDVRSIGPPDSNPPLPAPGPELLSPHIIPAHRLSAIKRLPPSQMPQTPASLSVEALSARQLMETTSLDDLGAALDAQSVASSITNY